MKIKMSYDVPKAGEGLTEGRIFEVVRREPVGSHGYRYYVVDDNGKMCKLYGFECEEVEDGV